jgi:hypothetical protein
MSTCLKIIWLVLKLLPRYLGIYQNLWNKYWNYCDSDSRGHKCIGWGLESQTLIEKSSENSLRTKRQLHLCTDAQPKKNLFLPCCCDVSHPFVWALGYVLEKHWLSWERNYCTNSFVASKNKTHHKSTLNYKRISGGAHQVCDPLAHISKMILAH